MIKSLMVTNHLGASITLELAKPEKSGFVVLDVDGLDPAKASVNMTDIASTDGAVFGSSRVNKRTIVLSLIFLAKPTIEDTRHLSYKYFPIGRPVRVRVTTDKRICDTVGYIESNTVNIFSDKEGATVSIVCGDPNLYSLYNDVTTFYGTEPLFEFPFSNESLTEPLIVFGDRQRNVMKTVYYTGDVPVGVTMRIHAVGEATHITLTNIRTGESMLIDTTIIELITGSGLIAGDDIIISTVKGNKFAYLQRSGVYYNIFNAISEDSDWFMVEKGDNLFQYSALTGYADLEFTISNVIAYEGI